MIFARPVWKRSCDNCREYFYDRDGKVAHRGGVPTRRVELPIAPIPCRKCPKIDSAFWRNPTEEFLKEPWKYAADITDDVHAAVQFYQECKAVGRFPGADDDPWIRPAAAAIESGIEQARQDTSNRHMASALADELESLIDRKRG